MTHQLTENTILFWDFKEDTYYDYRDEGDGGDGFTDVSSVYGQIYPYNSTLLRISRGANDDVYGVAFHGASYRLQNATVMPAAILNAMHDGDITIEFYARQYRLANYIGWLGMAGGTDGTEANNHQLAIFVDSSGYLRTFWEYGAASTDVSITSTKQLTAGQDHHIVFQRRDDGATCSVRFIVDGAAESWQTGYEFPTGGGNGGIIFGAATSQLSGSPNYPGEGVLGDIRLLKKLVSDSEITANNALKSTTAQLPYDASDSLFHYRLGSEKKPSLIDKSVNKLHLTRTNFSAYEPLEISDKQARVDFWGTGGRAIALHSSIWGQVHEQEVDRRDSEFRDKLALVGSSEPDYTIQFLLCGRGEDTFPNGAFLDFGTAANRLLYLQVNSSTRNFRYFWEYGSGTNVDYTTPSYMFSTIEARGLLHVGIKIYPAEDDGGTADYVIAKLYINGTLRDTSSELHAATNTSNNNLIFGSSSSADELWVQEIKIDSPGESAAEIQANYESLPTGETGTDSALTYIMRGYDSDVSHLVFWSSSEIDTDASDYTGNGPVTDIVVHKVLGT